MTARKPGQHLLACDRCKRGTRELIPDGPLLVCRKCWTQRHRNDAANFPPWQGNDARPPRETDRQP